MRFAFSLVLAAAVSTLGYAPPSAVLRASPALAAPEIGSGNFSLSSVNDTQTLYTSSASPPDTVAVTVTVTSGSVQVEKDVSGTWTSLGTLPAGRVGIFESDFAAVRVKALSASSAGAYSNRGPTSSTSDPDHVIGHGVMELGATPVRVSGVSP